MFVKDCFILSSPFFNAYSQSDLLGKIIFLGLVFLSILTWVILLNRGYLAFKARNGAKFFEGRLTEKKGSLLSIEGLQEKNKNPYYSIFSETRKNTLEILAKNKHFGLKGTGREEIFLSPTDVDIVESHVNTVIAKEVQDLEKNLYVLALVAALAPFLGLLGTVWGILTTFEDLTMQGGDTSHAVLQGLSLALATTVLGLVDAIPALVGYNYLKNYIRNFSLEMECFGHKLVTDIEMHYRKVDIS